MARCQVPVCAVSLFESLQMTDCQVVALRSGKLRDGVLWTVGVSCKVPVLLTSASSPLCLAACYPSCLLPSLPDPLPRPFPPRQLVRMAEDIDFKVPMKQACQAELSGLCKDVPQGELGDGDRLQ